MSDAFLATVDLRGFEHFEAFATRHHPGFRVERDRSLADGSAERWLIFGSPEITREDAPLLLLALKLGVESQPGASITLTHAPGVPGAHG
jgi:hypothetical protein